MSRDLHQFRFQIQLRVNLAVLKVSVSLLLDDVTQRLVRRNALAFLGGLFRTVD